ncbi:MAG: trehalose 6-phosphate synthase [Frankiales bacterium]|jgi:trehalose 6-phosphate synthase|nr:trehalose 6-phosphate synthase [Frankiales bacterium]
MRQAGHAKILVASNRGPVSFVEGEDGALQLRRGGGGLVSGMTVAARGPDTVWVCAALSTSDRQAAAQSPGGRLDLAGHDTDGLAVRMIELEPTTFRRAYNGVANSVLWFVNHQLYDTPNKPVFDFRFRREWDAFYRYNEAFAQALAEDAAPGASVLVQDYHLTLTPRMLRTLRPDLKIAHFTHTPWATPSYFSLLPDDVAAEVLAGILGADHAGFLAARWSRAFLRCCQELLGAEVDCDAQTVTYQDRVTQVAVHGLGVDAEQLRARGAQPDVESRRRVLRDRVGNRRILLRIDRTELSKNIVRGLAAYRELLRDHPEWRGKVVHLAFAYPSRHDLPEYREYTAAVQRIAQEIQDEFATDDWVPLLLEVNDDFARSLAAYRLADVVVVNPIRDGMNLVAKECPVLSDKGVVLVLSREAGAVDDLAADALVVNPYDVTATAEAMHRALSMSMEERARRHVGLVRGATALPPGAWFTEQLDALAG